MNFKPNLKISASNDSCLISIVSSPAGKFTNQNGNSYEYPDGYKLTIMKVGKAVTSCRLTVDDMQTLMDVVDKFSDVLGE